MIEKYHKGNRDISFKSLISYGVWVIGSSILMIEYPCAQNSNMNNSQLTDNSQFMIGLTIFFLLTFFLIVWLLIKRQQSELQFLQVSKNERFLKNAILARDESFYLWNENKELILKSTINIKFEDETIPDDMDDLKSRFTLADQNEFDANTEGLFKSDNGFSQQIELDQFNMHLTITGDVIIDKQLNTKCYIIWFKDNTVSEKIQRYQEAEANETSHKMKLLENALNMTNFPIWIRDKDLNFQWVNKAYVDAVDGITYKNVIDQNLELTTNTLGVSLRSMAESVNITGEAQSESHFIVLGGERKSMDFNNIPYEVDESQEAILGYAQDITELEEARGNLADHTESYAETLDKFSTAVAIFDSEMRLEYYNKAYLRLWGLPESLLFSHPSYSEILEALREARKLPEQANFPEWKQRQLEAYKEVIDPVESMMHLPDGKTLRVVMQHHPMGGMLVFYEDVTDYFALESSYNTLIAVQRETLDNLD